MFYKLVLLSTFDQLGVSVEKDVMETYKSFSLLLLVLEVK